MVKTLLFVADGQPLACLIRGDHEANEAKIRRAAGCQTLALADPATIEKVTGAPVGFAGPVGLKCRMLVDHDVALVQDAVVGGNEQDLHLRGVNPGRDWQVETTHDLRMAEAADECPRCPGKMELVHGIEVGHVFKLGTKYSVSLEAEYLDEKEQRHPMIMGCYGIGVNRIVAALCETSYDENGLIWPLSIAPYEVLVMPLNVSDKETMDLAERFYQELKQAGIDVLLDDRDARAGFKFKDADLIGIPLRIVLGGKGLKEGQAEVRWRWEAEARRVALDSTVAEVIRLVSARKAEELAKAPA